jgi:tRNA nucleotidyltransferase (CCA-adding enzyme)
MQVILSHEMADFDAIAASVAAGKLHPEATIVVGRHLGGSVHDFLNLHRDRFPTFPLEQIDAAAVTHVILVDVRRASRLGGIESLLRRVQARDPRVEVTVYDHHAPAPDDLPAANAVVEPVGSATTLLVERIRARSIDVDEVEATLFALGIHEDTGSLTFASSGARDAEALAWLMRKGVNLSVLNRYLKHGLGAAQRALLARVLDATKAERIGGLDLAIAAVDLERQVSDLGEIVSRAAELQGAPAMFAILSIGGRRVQVVGRSSTPLVHTGRVLGKFGGGGHAAAGSAIIRHGDGSRVRTELLEALRATVGRPALLSDVMTAPARSVPSELSMFELERELQSSGHSGAPVTDGSRLAGVISWRDLARARAEGQLDAPVRRYMTRQPLVASPDEPLESAIERMTVADVGRLPVVHDGELLGIVTRSDLLRNLYGRKGSMR